jgi:putative PIN family toxin of toxin-antitoxin system
VLLDTNVLVSAALFPDGVAARAFEAAVWGDEALVPRYVISELVDVCARKFPSRMGAIRRFVQSLSGAVEIIADAAEVSGEGVIRDAKDWPIWRAAKASRADILVTGDKDFLESGLTDPQILSPAQFLATQPRIRRR